MAFLSALYPSVDYTGGNADVQRAQGLVRKGNTTGIRDWFATLGDDHSARDFAMGVLTELNKRPDWLEQWKEDDPTDPLPWLFAGCQAIVQAWEARGSGLASTVSKSGRSGFEQWLQTAGKELQQAARLDPRDPLAPAMLLTVARGLQLPREKGDKWFARATTLDPEHRSAHNNMMQLLAAKWGGEPGEMMDFARDAAANAPDGSWLPGMLAEAHLEEEMLFEMRGNRAGAKAYFRDPAVAGELKEAAARSINHPAYNGGMWTVADHNLWMMACWKVRDRKGVRRHMRGTRGLVVHPWTNYGNPTGTFKSARDFGYWYVTAMLFS